MLWDYQIYHFQKPKRNFESSRGFALKTGFRSRHLFLRGNKPPHTLATEKSPRCISVLCFAITHLCAKILRSALEDGPVEHTLKFSQVEGYFGFMLHLFCLLNFVMNILRGCWHRNSRASVSEFGRWSFSRALKNVICTACMRG